MAGRARPQCTTRPNENSPPSTSTGITSFGPNLPSRISLDSGFSTRCWMARFSGRSDHQIALDFVTAVRGVPADHEEAALLLSAVESCCGGD